MLTVNGLTVADAVMIPMQCEYYALEGLSDLVNTIKKVRQHLNPRLEIEGLLRTMYDPRNTLAQQVSAQLQSHFGDKVYTNVIPRNVLDRAATGAALVDRLATLKLGQLGPGRYQPRTKMDEASLQELAASIRVQGL